MAEIFASSPWLTFYEEKDGSRPRWRDSSGYIWVCGNLSKFWRGLSYSRQEIRFHLWLDKPQDAPCYQLEEGEKLDQFFCQGCGGAVWDCEEDLSTTRPMGDFIYSGMTWVEDHYDGIVFVTLESRVRE